MAEIRPIADATRPKEKKPVYLSRQSWAIDFTDPSGGSKPAVRITMEVSENLSAAVEEDLQTVFDEIAWKISEIVLS